jgi:hypothetical protein
MLLRIGSSACGLGPPGPILRIPPVMGRLPSTFGVISALAVSSGSCNMRIQSTHLKTPQQIDWEPYVVNLHELNGAWRRAREP